MFICATFGFSAGIGSIVSGVKSDTPSTGAATVEGTSVHACFLAACCRLVACCTLLWRPCVSLHLELYGKMEGCGSSTLGPSPAQCREQILVCLVTSKFSLRTNRSHKRRFSAFTGNGKKLTSFMYGYLSSFRFLWDAAVQPTTQQWWLTMSETKFWARCLASRAQSLGVTPEGHNCNLLLYTCC